MPFGHLLRIGVLGALLVAIAVMGRPCAEGVSEFIVSFGPPGERETQNPLGEGELRRLSDEEIRERFPSLLEDGGPSESAPEPEPGPDSEPASAPAPEPEPGPDSDSDPEREPDSEPDSEREPDSESESGA